MSISFGLSNFLDFDVMRSCADTIFTFRRSSYNQVAMELGSGMIDLSERLFWF